MTLPSGSLGLLSDRSSFRRFPVEFRRRVVGEYFGLPAYSVERGALLRREGLTAPRLYEWAKQASVKSSVEPSSLDRKRAINVVLNRARLIGYVVRMSVW